MTINPKFRALIPPLASEELAQLESNIVADGCRDPLVTWKGTLVDGHNRFDICTRRKLPFKTVEIDFADEDEALVWIIRNQFGRRNITLTARCRLAKELALALKPKAKEKQKEHGGTAPGRGKNTSVNIDESDSIDVREQAAKEAGVSTGSLTAYEYLEKNATQEELSELEVNPNAKMHKTVKTVKERKASTARKEKRTTAAAGTPLDERIIVGDFRKHAGKVADGSLSLIFTDPPYDKKASKMFPGLADFAQSKLADGGSIIFYCGHLQLPAAFAAFAGKLRHWWTCACLNSGDKPLMREYGIRVGWKPVLWFVKGTRDDKSNIVQDVITGGQEKSSHDWQQAESEAAYWIKELCPKDGIVCDPFLGGATTAVAAQKLGLQWIGFEIDVDTAKIASQRVQ